MRALLIDPIARTITEVEHEDKYTDIYRLIEAQPFDVMNIGDGESLFFDDEGLLKEPPPIDYFRFGDDGHPISGKALVLGVNDEGDSIATKLTIAELQGMVQFLRLRFVGFEDISGKVNHPVFGVVEQIGSRAIFEPME